MESDLAIARNGPISEVATKSRSINVISALVKLLIRSAYELPPGGAAALPFPDDCTPLLVAVEQATLPLHKAWKLWFQ